MSRLVVVSNRVPSPADADADGLAVALRMALRESGGFWFGWSGGSRGESSGRVTVVPFDAFAVAAVDLSRADIEGYHEGFAMQALWPLFHGRPDLAIFDAAAFGAYQRVNALFAHRLRPLLAADDVIWAHDFHLIPLGRELRRRGVENPLGFFLHAPFPAPAFMLALPWHAELAEALMSYDLIGFQTERDRRNFCDLVVRELDGSMAGDTLAVFGRHVRTGVFPVGIDTDGFAAMAASTEVVRRVERLGDCLGGKAAIVGVDALDYTRGLIERFNAFESLLERFPEERGRVSLIQVAAPSREVIPGLAEIRATLEQISGRVNGRYAEVDWVPLQYLHRSFGRRRLAALYRCGRVGLVTPLADGMNLVAKEYVAAQPADDPGVLVLSRFAGAARELDGAIIVNPYDVDAVADGLRAALHMPLSERQARWQRMMLNLRRNDVSRWRGSFLTSLGAATRRVYQPAVA